MTTKTKATRKLKSFDFSSSDASISLVGPAQGGAANGFEVLAIKSLNRSEDFIRKASKVTVQMEITEYLSTFYGLYHEKAEILARALGFTTDMQSREDDDPWDYNKYIDEKVSSIEVIKSLEKSPNLLSELTKLSEAEYLQFIQDQEVLEKAFKEIEKNSSKVNSSVENGSTGAVADAKLPETKRVDPDIIVTKGTEMSDKNDTKPEMIEKSALVEIQKALDIERAELQKARDELKKLDDERKEAITKQRLEVVKSAVKNDEKANVLFKAFNLLTEQADFDSAVKAVTELVKQAEDSEMFKEQGASGQGEETTEQTPLTKAINKLIASKQPKSN